MAFKTLLGFLLFLILGQTGFAREFDQHEIERYGAYEVKTNIKCRVGPGKNYDVVKVLKKGTAIFSSYYFKKNSKGEIWMGLSDYIESEPTCYSRAKTDYFRPVITYRDNRGVAEVDCFLSHVDLPTSIIVQVVYDPTTLSYLLYMGDPMQPGFGKPSRGYLDRNFNNTSKKARFIFPTSDGEIRITKGLTVDPNTIAFSKAQGSDYEEYERSLDYDGTWIKYESIKENGQVQTRIQCSSDYE